ncbi:SDR family oxidoreductase [Shinella sp. BYT-45]|uniref:SDR family oxidoreductase n=1 Tax=Shinella sp. BYT-45 TaxID=3377377 RepID=UPI00397FEF76
MSQTVLITGTSTGIGRETAKLFQSQGWNVIATMRAPEKETELNQLENVRALRLDVTDEESIRAAVAQGTSEFGSIDVLVNNAGFGSFGLLEATSLDAIREQFEANVVGLLATTKAVLPHMRERRQGVVVNISSMGGCIGFPLGTLYHGSKFAVEGLSEALSYELAAVGIRVKIVEPGMVRTDFSGRSVRFSDDESLSEYRDVVANFADGYAAISDTPPAEPDEVARTIFAAATDGTDRLRYVSGQDAERLLARRLREDDSTFFVFLRGAFRI